MFEYYDDFIISEIHPQLVPDYGGVVIDIYGKYFIENIYCIINNKNFLSEFVSSTQIRCNTPPTTAGEDYLVLLSTNL